MADSSLDDFFAKKDKSKKKSKSKSQPIGDGDDVSKTVTDKKFKKKRDKDPNSAGGLQNSSGINPKEDEEWKDFEEEKEVDYTGLRIQNMQIAKEEQEREQADGEEEDCDEDGEVREKKEGASGPWNKGGEPLPVPVPVAVVAEPAKEETPTPKATGKYVPPSMRNQSSSLNPAFPSSRRKKTAPNLQSEEDFPTLGGGPMPGMMSPYSNTASSDLIENPNQRKGGNLTLENKFSALQD